MFRDDWYFLSYYYARYIGLCIVYGLIFGMVIYAPAYFLGPLLENFFNISYLSDAIEWIARILTGIIVCKKVLNEVFFKDYETFRLLPKISRITYGFSSIYLLCNVAAIKISEYAIDAIFKKLATNDLIYLSTEIVFWVLADSIVLRYFVNRFATIEIISNNNTLEC